jgi:hypothetical protein
MMILTNSPQDGPHEWQSAVAVHLITQVAVPRTYAASLSKMVRKDGFVRENQY